MLRAAVTSPTIAPAVGSPGPTARKHGSPTAFRQKNSMKESLTALGDDEGISRHKIAQSLSLIWQYLIV